MTSVQLAPVLGALGLMMALLMYRYVKAQPAGTAAMVAISEQIHTGAMAFLRKEYSILIWFVLVVAVLLGAAIHPLTALAFIAGGLCSMLAGFFGMKAATRANVRTANAARESGRDKALAVAFYGGSVMGLILASLGLLGLGTLYLIFGTDPTTAHNIHGFAMGAGVVALFYRVGGGIFTKSADVGADLVGKVEAGIPEDDPRNPGVIADNVGDNVGDCAGMAADLFETFAVTVVATMLLGSIFFTDVLQQEQLMLYPLLVCGVGVVSSVAGMFFVRLGASQNIMGALYKGLIATGVICTVLALLVGHGLIAALFGQFQKGSEVAKPLRQWRWSWTFGLYAATANISVPIILALVSTSAYHIEGMRKRGVISYFRSWLPGGLEEMNVVGKGAIFAIEVISHTVRPISLSVRLFANILAGSTAMNTARPRASTSPCSFRISATLVCLRPRTLFSHDSTTMGLNSGTGLRYCTSISDVSAITDRILFTLPIASSRSSAMIPPCTNPAPP